VLPTVTSAYAEVKKAIALTASSAGSGTIVNQFSGGKNEGVQTKWAVQTTMKWYGEDFSFSDDRADQNNGVEREVAGRFYSLEGGAWYHSAELDAANDPGGAAKWVAACRRDINGGRIVKVIDVLKGLKKQPGKGGSTVFAGHAPAKEIAAQYPDIDSVPFRNGAHLADADTDAKFVITVGADGVIRSWSVTYNAWDADWSYSAQYEDLGSTPAIPVPDHFVER
jgi:hypothetical protein